MERLIKTRRNNNGSPAADFSEMTREQYIRDATHPIENAIKRAETAAELSSHIEDGVEYHTEHGSNEKDALRKTLASMGDPKELAANFRKLYPGRIDWFILAFALVFFVSCFYLFRFGNIPDMDSEFTLYSLLAEACTVGMAGVFISLCAAAGVRTPMYIALASSLFINAGSVVYNSFLRPSAQFLFVLYSLFAGEYGDIPRFASRYGNAITLKNYRAVSVVFFLVFLAAAVGVYITHNKMRSPACAHRFVKCNRILRRSLLAAAILICAIDLAAAFSIYRAQKSGEAYKDAYAGYYVFEGGGAGDIEAQFSPRIAAAAEGGLSDEESHTGRGMFFAPADSVTIDTTTLSFRVYCSTGADFLESRNYFERRGTVPYNQAAEMNVYYSDVEADTKAGYLALIPMDRDYRPLFANASWEPVPESGDELLLPCSAGDDANIFIRLVFGPDT